MAPPEEIIRNKMLNMLITYRNITKAVNIVKLLFEKSKP